MPEPIAILISTLTVNGASQGFYLLGEASGELGQITSDGALSTASVRIHRLVGPLPAAPEVPLAAGTGAIDLCLSRPIDVPGALFAHTPNSLPGSAQHALQSTANLNQQLTSQVAAEFLAIVAEAQRRLNSVEVDYATAKFLDASAFHAQGFAGATLRLRFWSQQQNPSHISVGVRIEIAAHARIALPAGVNRAVSLVVLFEATGQASLRIDADDFNLRLPAFTLPAFSLALPLPPLQLAAGLAGAASTLELFAQRYVNGVQVQYTNPSGTETEPKLALRLDNQRVDWALVTAAFNPATDWIAPLPHLADLTIEVTLGGVHNAIVLTHVKLASFGAGSVVEGQVTITPAPIQIAAPADQRFGPLDVGWDQLIMSPSASAAGGVAANSAVRMQVSFENLFFRVHDDHSARLAFSGTVEVDPSGIRIVSLRLVAPFPLQLVAAAGGAVLRAAGNVLRIAVDCAGATEAQVKTLLEVLGKIAVAAGRALNFIGAKAAGSLTAVAELVGQALARLASLANADTALSVEVRFATDPLELRQVLVTSRSAIAAPRTLDVAGLRLQCHATWQPGLLIDFATQPGAYLVLTHAGAPAVQEIATISTDLWLRRDSGPGTSEVNAVRDADGTSTTGDRANEPLIKLEIGHPNPADAADMLIVLAGIARGHPVFFQSLRGKLQAVPGVPALKSTEGDFVLEPLNHALSVDIQFKEDRILPLLGMGDPGTSSGANFLDQLKQSLSNVVWVKGATPHVDLQHGTADLDLKLGLKAAGLETEIILKATLVLETLEVTLTAGDAFPISSRRIEETALGLVWVIEQVNDAQRLANDAVDMFRISFSGNQSGFELNRDVARMQLRFNGLSDDGKGVVFNVDTFKIGPGGLDIKASVDDAAVNMRGIRVPFRFTAGGLEIKGGRLVSALVTGRGILPPDLIGAAECSVGLTFGEVAGEGIVLQACTVDLDKKNDPIVCHASRFTLTITDLGLSFVKDGGYHFFYLVTGSLRFSPKQGEFESGLLQYLDGIEMDLERTPLSADPSVLAKHISFQKSLNPKKSFNLFNLFTFELRGFGYHPASPKFGGAPAVNISGQIKFAEIGDVMQPSIDFHGLWIAPPAQGESLPRIKADGLGIDLNLKGSIRVRGTVLAVDADSHTVEPDSDLAPPGYNTYGFLGQGEFDIPGWGSMAASLGFLELERQDRPGERRKSFFFFAEQRKLAIEIPTVVWTFYLREVGFGMGFRYTLDALAAADRATSVPKLISALDDVSKRQGDLHKFSTWKPEPEGDRVTLALKGALQTYPASKTWSDEEEETAENPFLFDVVAAIRSDFTLFMGLRGWLGTNYIDYLNDKDGLRSKPGLRGYLYISAPQQRLLARMIGDSKGYLGERIPALKKDIKGKPPALRLALQSVDWSATLFIKPGLFHYELGWPNQLVVRLFDEPDMRVIVRGGMIFRATDDGLLWGYNIEADAFMRFSGSLQIGPVGVCAEASLSAHLVARVLCYLSYRIQGSLVYGLVALDASLDVSVRAWLEVDLPFGGSFTINISFGVSLQLSAAIEIALLTNGVGAHVHARVAISAFGTTLSVSVGFTIGSDKLDDARARVQRFLAMSIGAEEPDAAPAFANQSGDRRLEQDATYAKAVALAPEPELGRIPAPNVPAKTNLLRAQNGKGMAVRETNFWAVLRKAFVAPKAYEAPPGEPIPFGEKYAYALLVPQESAPADGEPAGQWRGAFYSIPAYDANGVLRDEATPTHVLKCPAGMTDESKRKLADLWRYDALHDKFFRVSLNTHDEITVCTRWSNPLDTENGAVSVSLAEMFDECFLSDTNWTTPSVRTIDRWWEPPPRRHFPTAVARDGTPEQRVSERDMVQRARLACAASNPLAEGVHQARSTVMAMFLDQFVKLSSSGVRPDGIPVKKAHVCDIGLVFYGTHQALEALAELSIDKATVPRSSATNFLPGRIEVLNPWENWFEREEPELAADSCEVAPNGVKLDWRLQTQFATSNQKAAAIVLHDARAHPEQLLHHYNITRTVEGQEFTPRTMQVTPASTIGGADGDGLVRLLASEFQCVDDLADLNAELRRALLPVTDEALGFEAAQTWAKVFGSRDAVTLTYSVTPVDIAGSPGSPKSFRIDINRPTPPLRPAEAELRFIVKRMNGAGDDRGSSYSAGTRPAHAIAAVLALKDASFQPPDDKVTRYYNLIADPEIISPSGHYGSDGLTERRLGIGTAGVYSAAARQWRIPAEKFAKLTDENDKVPVDTFIDPLEPDHDNIRNFPYWRLLAGKVGLKRVDEGLGNDGALGDDFLDRLWNNRSGQRIATRFVLETVQEWTLDDGTTASARSRAVPVAIEIRVEPIDPARHDIGLLRPEAFEWPVHLEMPALKPGQVRAGTGFARLRVPSVSPSLDKLIAGAADACSLVRDPERRILTEVSFEAATRFDARDDVPLDACHRSAVAGFDLHELDLDDLARADTDTAIEFAENAAIWRRARRVARIERVSAQTARLTPDNNKDWLGWHAHYPSETWRLMHRADRREGQAHPVRAGWYSAAESTVAFAARMPRRRLLPTVPEAAISSLMAKGRPATLTVSLGYGPKAVPELLPELLAFAELDLGPQRPDTALASTNAGNILTITLPPEAAGIQTAPLLRAALLRLSWNAPVESGSLARFNDLHLHIAGELGGGKSTGEITLPLTLSGPLHPVIEEVLGELEYSTSSPGLYRQYVVSVQPVQTATLKDFAGFLETTSADTDPYGWATLQQLGLARTVKLFDRDTDTFLDTSALLRRINDCMRKTVQRYQTAYSPLVENFTLGQPMVEVLLRPGRDRVAGPFDAILDETGVELETKPLSLADDGLAIVQLSLRPQPAAGRNYQLLELGWVAGLWPSASSVVGTTTRIVRGYDIKFASIDNQRYDVIRIEDGRALSVGPSDSPTLPATWWPKGQVPNTAQKDLRFLIRYADGAVPAQLPSLYARVAIFDLANNSVRETLEAVAAPLGLFASSSQTTEASGNFPNEWAVMAEALGRFPKLSADEWAVMLTTPPVPLPAGLEPGTPVYPTVTQPAQAFESMRANLRCAYPDLAWPQAGNTAEPRFAELKLVAATYLAWSQRFLDYGAAPDTAPTDLPFALAAPVKCNPWRLAADHDGMIRMSFLHADRWAHTRAYAVRPTSRYQNLALGAGYYEDQADSERLVTAALLRPENQNRFMQSLGYALAVSPRTERIEPPVILGSSLVAQPGGEREWQLVVARHGEEALAFSNRSLFGRLGTEGTALSFLREYRDPQWPDRLKQAMLAAAQLDPTVHPLRAAQLPQAVSATGAPIDAAAIGEAAKKFPSLWKGADIWRIGQLPPHYRVTALAVARAGLVVSRVVSATQDATPRRPLHPALRLPGSSTPQQTAEAAVILGKPTIAIRRNAALATEICIEDLRLVSYEALMESSARAWISGGASDVAWWPDPSVSYALLRCGQVAPTDSFEDEYATVRLLAQAQPANAPPTSPDLPVAVRCRGTRVQPLAPRPQNHPAGDMHPVASTTVVGAERKFTLAFRVAPCVQPDQRIGMAAAGTVQQRAAFNAAAINFAHIDSQFVARIGPFPPAPAGPADAAAWLAARAGEVAQVAVALDTALAGAEPALVAAVQQAAADMLTEAGQPLRGDWATASAWLTRDRVVPFTPDPGTLPRQIVPATGTGLLVDLAEHAEELVLRDLPTEVEANAVLASGHPAALTGGRLWSLCRERLLGGASGAKFVIRAVDTRNANDALPAPGAPPGQQVNPGEVEVEVGLPF